jgi:TonB family protein
VGVVEVMARRLRSSILAALVLVLTGCATQSQETVPRSLTSPLPSRRLGDDAIFGHGGILGPPIAADSTDPLYSDYLEHVRQRIQERWGYPCVRAGQSCDYKNASVEAEFGILKNGRLQYVEIVRNSGFPIYDEYATNAIKRASPFRPVPPTVMAAMRPGSTGIPIRARFVYEGAR